MVIVYKDKDGEKKKPEPETYRIECDNVYHHPKRGQTVQVTMQVDYPSYQFTFGIPREGVDEREVAYFEHKDSRQGQQSFGMYLDKQELDEWIKGLSDIRDKID